MMESKQKTRIRWDKTKKREKEPKEKKKRENERKEKEKNEKMGKGDMRQRRKVEGSFPTLEPFGECE